MNSEKKRQFADRLRAQRRHFLERLSSIDQSWRNLNEREIEFEETATKESLVPYLDRLDEMDKQQLAAIDRALGRLEADIYDVCEVCGGAIVLKRLEAMPWTTRCIGCASEADRGGRRRVEVELIEETELPEEMQGLSDEEVEEAVWDAVRQDGSVAEEELSITCRQGVLLLEGLLPNKRQHSHLQQLVYDVLGFTEVEDMIRIDRTAWQQEERTPGIEIEDGEPGTEDAAEDSGAGTTMEAIKEGKTIPPADEIVPEEGSGRNR